MDDHLYMCFVLARAQEFLYNKTKLARSEPGKEHRKPGVKSDTRTRQASDVTCEGPSVTSIPIPQYSAKFDLRLATIQHDTFAQRP